MRCFLVFQARAGAEQDYEQKRAENSTSSVQQATESHIYMESNSEPHHSASFPCVLHTSYGRTTCSNQETKERAWKGGGKDQKLCSHSDPGKLPKQRTMDFTKTADISAVKQRMSSSRTVCPFVDSV